LLRFFKFIILFGKYFALLFDFIFSNHYFNFTGRKAAIRASTLTKSAETAKRQREREARAKRLLKKRLAAKRRRQARG